MVCTKLTPFFFFFDLIYFAESYSTYNKNIVRTYKYIYNNNKYHMYILSKKPRITQKVVKLISIVVPKNKNKKLNMIEKQS